MASIIILFIFLINFACSNFEESPQYFIRLETDNNIYSADSTTTIYLKVSNNGSDPVYFLCKGVILLEEYEDGTLNNYWTVHDFEYCNSSTPIQPNSVHTWDLTFLNWKVLPDAKFNENVLYKLYFDLYTDKNLKNPMNVDDQISNYFKIIRD